MAIEQPWVLLRVWAHRERSRALRSSDGFQWESEEGKQPTTTRWGHIPSGLIRLEQELAA